MISVVIPVYRNSETLPALLSALAELHRELAGELEAVFVVDGSPDDCQLQLATQLPTVSFPAQLLVLSRNFGAFAAIRAGMAAARGERIAVMAADLQEPPGLILEFDRRLRTLDHDVAIGQRLARQDPLLPRLLAQTFWRLYRRWVQPEIPAGGVDVFAVQRSVRDHLLALGESNSSLVGLLFWVGFRRVLVPYQRQARAGGKSAWTWRKKLRYLADSVFSFTDLPIRVLLWLGWLGLSATLGLGLVVLIARTAGQIPVPGYAATVLLILAFGGLNCLGLGIIGSYVWRTFENTKARPNFIVATHLKFPSPSTSEGPPTHG